MNQTTYWQRPVFIALAAGVVLAPLAFGGTTEWFTDVFAATAGALGISWWIGNIVRPGGQTAHRGPIIIPACLFGIAILWCFGQALIPVSDIFAAESWRNAADLLRGTGSPVISLNPEASIAGALRLTGYGIVFFLCYRFADSEARAIRLLTTIAGAGAIYALYGIGLELTESNQVLWYDRTFEAGNLSSTFPNRNAFASYATLCLLSGCMVLYRRRIRLEDTVNGWKRSLVSIVRYFFRRNGWFFYAAIALFIAILLTHSRAGLATSVIAFAVFAGCAARGSGFRSAAAAGSVLIALCAVALMSTFGGATVERFEKFHAAALERMEIYRLTIAAISDRSLLGTGLGTFPDVFPTYRTAELRAKIDFAHNSYLENALEMGVPAAIAFYGALAMLLIVFVRATIAKHTAHPYPALGIAVLAAGLFHSLFDYAVQFPAVAITFAALLGIAYAQSTRSGDAYSKTTQRPDRRAT